MKDPTTGSKRKHWKPTRLRLSCLGLIAGLSLVACGQSPTRPNSPNVTAEAPSTVAPAKTFGSDSVWNRQLHQAEVYPCYNGNRDLVGCLREAMIASGASASAVSFFDANQGWLISLAVGLPVSVGRFEPLSGRDIGATLVLLSSSQGMIDVSEALRRQTVGRLVESDPRYEELLSAAQRTYPDLPAVSFNGRSLLESISSDGSTERIIIQGQLHAGCNACLLGVSERYAMEFDSSGQLLRASLLGMCTDGDPKAVLVSALPHCPTPWPV